MKDNAITIRIIGNDEILTIVPLLQKLENFSIPEELIRERLPEMVTQNYECAGVYDAEKLIGICGLCFQTRHYAGRTIETEHVIIDEAYRNRGLGKRLMEFVYNYAREKSCNWVELNSYVNNFPSHKFYYNEGFVGKGFHFVKILN